VKDIFNKGSNNIDEWRQEIEMMTVNRSPYIVEIIGYSNNKNILSIVMECMENGSLYDVLHIKKTSLSVSKKLEMALQCTLGVAELHKNAIVHRDIKSLNFLVSEDYSCKLCDFGTSLLESKSIDTTYNCTPLWAAPEVRTGRYSYPADIFSLGVVKYEIFVNLPEYDNINNQIVISTEFYGKSVVLPCINICPENRPDCLEVAKSIKDLISNTGLTTVDKVL